MEDDVKSIDWQNCLELTHGNVKLADEILASCINNFPRDRELIETALLARDFKSLNKRTHKFHGSCCYTGVPKIRRILRYFEDAALYQRETECQFLFRAMIKEMEIIQAVFAENTFKELTP